MKGLKILQIMSRTNCDSGGGIQALELSRALLKRGHAVWFAAKPRGSCRSRCEEMGIPFFPLPMKGYLDFTSIKRLRELIEREGIQVIHAHKGLAHGLALSAIVGMPHPPVVVTNRGVSFPLSFWNKWKYLIPWTKGVVVVADSVRAVLEASGIPREKIRVIYGGVDLKRFSPIDREEACKRLGLDPTLDYVAMVAQFRPWKGHHILVEAMDKLAEVFPRLTVLLAGKTYGSAYRALREEIEKRGLKKRFIFLGYRRDVELVMAAAHFLVAPSLGGEGLPGTFREAFALCRPVISSDVAGAKEVVIHERTGILLPPGDPTLLVQAMACLLSNRCLRDRMGKKGRSLVTRLYAHEHRAFLMETYYKRLLEKA